MPPLTDAPDFSRLAQSHAAARPLYPAELFEWLASAVLHRGAAWDTATGNGQAAIALAAHFDRVVATDRSREQISHARPHARVEYRVAEAEASGLPAGSVDLVVAAAAIHWYDLRRSYAEAERVARGGGVLAAWTYHVAHVEPPFDRILWPFYRDVVKPYFGAGARLVDEGYRRIVLPGHALKPPAFTMSTNWTAAEMLDFVRTWSGVQSYRDATGIDPVRALERPISRLWGDDGSTREIRWPLYIRASRV